MFDWKKGNLKHIEVEGCIINITTGLKDKYNRKVTIININPDGKIYGDNWKLYGTTNNKVVNLKKKV